MEASAPAIGGPVSDAMLLILCAIPNQVPRDLESGQTCENTLGGRGTRAPDIPPIILH